MTRWLVAAGLSALIVTMSCTPSYESKGNQAYKAAQRASGDAQRLLEKEAYIYYRKAVKGHPDKISKQLRNRFVEMTVQRANMVLVDGSSAMDALPLFMGDIDSVLSADVESDLRNQYADFLVLLADSSFANQKLYAGLSYVKRASEVAADKAPYQKRMEEVVENLSKDNLEIARMEYEQGVAEKDYEALVRAEFRTKLALYYDKNYPGAAEMLSTLYKANLQTMSAYDAVVQDKPDTNIYDVINKYDILLAIPDVSRAGTSVTTIVSMYNYSYNPLRLRAQDFALVNEDGKKFPAALSSNLGKEILDQEHEVKMTLRFGAVSGTLKKLVYESGEHYTEKNFF
jgi:hypothetical protein